MAEKKFKINAELDKLPYPKFRAALRFLPRHLNINPSTLSKYRALTVEDMQDIPYTHAAKLEISLVCNQAS